MHFYSFVISVPCVFGSSVTKHIHYPNRQRQKFILLSVKALTFLDASRWVLCYQMKECYEQYCTRHNAAKLIWRYVTDL